MNQNNDTRRGAETYLSQSIGKTQGAVQAILSIATDPNVRLYFPTLPFLSWTRHTKAMWASKLQSSSNWQSITAGTQVISRTPTISLSIRTANKTPATDPMIKCFCSSQLTKNIWSKTSFWRSTQWFVLRESFPTLATRALRFKLRTLSGISLSMTTWVGTREPLALAYPYFIPRSNKDW